MAYIEWPFRIDLNSSLNSFELDLGLLGWPQSTSVQRYLNALRSFDDGGYKSDGEAYHGSNCYKSGSRSRHNAGSCQRPMRSLSGHLIQGHQSQHGELHSRGIVPRGNGYLSDGEGYVIQNQRVSRSGKYGSQASSPRSDHHRGEAMNDEESEESEEEEEEEEEEEDDDEEEEILDGTIDNIEQEIHLNDMVAAKEQEMKQAVSSKAPSAAQADLIVSYSAFQAEAAALTAGSGESSRMTARLKTVKQPISCIGQMGHFAGGTLTGAQEQLFMHAAVTTTVAETVRRSSSNGCVVDGPVMSRSASEGNGGGQRSRRSSRSNSRQGEYDGAPGAGATRPMSNVHRGGGASSSQSDHRSDGGYRSDGWYQSMQPRSQPPTTKRPDGYRSEGSTESPKHVEQTSDLIQQNSGGGGGSSRPRSSSKHSRGAPASTSMQPPIPPLMQPPRNPHCQQGPPPMHHFPPRASQSFQSFQRQESTGSFYSSHSAPTNCGNKHHHHHHHHHGPLGRHPPQNLESCSTQSSSSSASGPPDYATCAGVPPPYDQASMKRKHPPNPPPRGGGGGVDDRIPDPMGGAPKIPPHQSSGGGSSSGSSRRKPNRSVGDLGNIGNHSRSNSALRQPPQLPSQHQQQQQQQQQQQPQQPHRHNFAMNKSRQAGANELYYMGEFYG